jgi:hypothetical protein
VLEADQPPALLGKDTAASPIEHLLHALASCLTTSMVYHAAARGIHIEEVESSLEGDIDLHGFLELDKNVRNGYLGWTPCEFSESTPHPHSPKFQANARLQARAVERGGTAVACKSSLGS